MRCRFVALNFSTRSNVINLNREIHRGNSLSSDFPSLFGEKERKRKRRRRRRRESARARERESEGERREREREREREASMDAFVISVPPTVVLSKVKELLQDYPRGGNFGGGDEEKGYVVEEIKNCLKSDFGNASVDPLGEEIKAQVLG